MNEQFDVVAVLSGGIDSSTLLYYLVKSEGKRVAALTFRYGQRHDRELIAARNIANSLKVTLFEMDLRIPFSVFNQDASSLFADSKLDVKNISQVVGDPQPKTYIPNRNMIFLSMACGFAESEGIDRVVYGAQMHDLYGYWDTTPEFLENMNAIVGLNRKNGMRIDAPFVAMSKTDVVKAGVAMNVPFGLTWSCYKGGDYPCMECATCAERNAAFKEVGIPDPLWDKEPS